MKKNFTLFKTLLVAAGLCVGSSAWADDIYTQDYEATGATADWTTSTSGRFTPVLLEESGNHYLSVDQNSRHNNGTTISSTSLSGKVAAGTDFTMTFDFKIQSSTDQTPASFTIYDAANSNAMLSLTATGKYSKTWQINGSTTQTVSLDGTETNQAIASHTWFSAKVSRKDDVTYLTITKKSDGTVVFARTPVTTVSSTGGLGKMEFVTKRYDANFAIDNIVVRDIAEGDVPAVSVYKITTKYQLVDETSVLEDRVDNVTEGESYNPVYSTSFDDDNYRYTYVSGASSIASVSEDATITIVYSREELAEHTVKFNASGNIEKTLATVIVKDAKSYTFAYPRYLADEGTLYQIVKVRYDQGYQSTVSNVTADVDRTETYNKIGTNIAFFSEAEDIASLTQSSTNNNIPVRCSGGNAAYAATDAEIVTLAPGKYTITAAVFGNAGTDFVFKNGETELYTITTAGYQLEQTSDELTFTEPTTITLAAVGNGGTSPKVIDYIIIKCTSVSASIVSEAGWATLYTPFALDFSSVSGLTAYTASVDGSTVTLTEVENVPAGTGVVLKGAADTYSIPVAASSETAKGDLTGSTTEATAYDAVSGSDLYMLALNDANEAQFTKVTSGSIAAGKAYLAIASGNNSKLRVVFAGNDATAINGVESVKAENGSMFNLAGQRVGKDFKGIVLVNGKKFMNK